jgi:putative membrane protein
MRQAVVSTRREHDGYRDVRPTRTPTISHREFTAPRFARPCAAAVFIASTAAGFPTPAAAHTQPATPETLWRSWTIEPFLVLGLLLLGCAYLFGARALWQRAGYGRGIPYWRAAAFLGGLTAIAVALLSPLEAMSASLFSAHMTQHLILILAAAPLLVLGAPITPLLWVLPPDLRQRVARFWKRNRGTRVFSRLFSSALAVLVAHAFVIWLWHLPALYDTAIEHRWLHSLEHASFLFTGVLFWWVILPVAGRRVLSPGLGVLYVFLAAMQSSVLGVLMLLSRSVWYEAHQPYVAYWDMTPLEDQQLAGVIMWVPAGTIYAITALWLLASWLNRLERTTLSIEQELDA